MNFAIKVEINQYGDYAGWEYRIITGAPNVKAAKAYSVMLTVKDHYYLGTDETWRSPYFQNAWETSESFDDGEEFSFYVTQSIEVSDEELPIVSKFISTTSFEERKIIEHPVAERIGIILAEVF